MVQPPESVAALRARLENWKVLELLKAVHYVTQHYWQRSQLSSTTSSETDDDSSYHLAASYAPAAASTALVPPNFLDAVTNEIMIHPVETKDKQRLDRRSALAISYQIHQVMLQAAEGDGPQAVAAFKKSKHAQELLNPTLTHLEYLKHRIADWKRTVVGDPQLGKMLDEYLAPITITSEADRKAKMETISEDDKTIFVTTISEGVRSIRAVLLALMGEGRLEPLLITSQVISEAKSHQNGLYSATSVGSDDNTLTTSAGETPRTGALGGSPVFERYGAGGLAGDANGVVGSPSTFMVAGGGVNAATQEAAAARQRRLDYGSQQRHRAGGPVVEQPAPTVPVAPNLGQKQFVASLLPPTIILSKQMLIQHKRDLLMLQKTEADIRRETVMEYYRQLYAVERAAVDEEQTLIEDLRTQLLEEEEEEKSTREQEAVPVEDNDSPVVVSVLPNKEHSSDGGSSQDDGGKPGLFSIQSASISVQEPKGLSAQRSSGSLTSSQTASDSGSSTVSQKQVRKDIPPFGAKRSSVASSTTSSSAMPPLPPKVVVDSSTTPVPPPLLHRTESTSTASSGGIATSSSSAKDSSTPSSVFTPFAPMPSHSGLAEVPSRSSTFGSPSQSGSLHVVPPKVFASKNTPRVVPNTDALTSPIEVKSPTQQGGSAFGELGKLHSFTGGRADRRTSTVSSVALLGIEQGHRSRRTSLMVLEQGLGSADGGGLDVRDLEVERALEELEEDINQQLSPPDAASPPSPSKTSPVFRFLAEGAGSPATSNQDEDPKGVQEGQLSSAQQSPKSDAMRTPQLPNSDASTNLNVVGTTIVAPPTQLGDATDLNDSCKTLGSTFGKGSTLENYPRSPPLLFHEKAEKAATEEGRQPQDKLVSISTATTPQSSTQRQTLSPPGATTHRKASTTSTIFSQTSSAVSGTGSPSIKTLPKPPAHQGVDTTPPLPSVLQHHISSDDGRGSGTSSSTTPSTINVPTPKKELLAHPPDGAVERMMRRLSVGVPSTLSSDGVTPLIARKESNPTITTSSSNLISNATTATASPLSEKRGALEDLLRDAVLADDAEFSFQDKVEQYVDTMLREKEKEREREAAKKQKTLGILNNRLETRRGNIGDVRAAKKGIKTTSRMLSAAKLANCCVLTGPIKQEMQATHSHGVSLPHQHDHLAFPNSPAKGNANGDGEAGGQRSPIKPLLPRCPMPVSTLSIARRRNERKPAALLPPPPPASQSNPETVLAPHPPLPLPQEGTGSSMDVVEADLMGWDSCAVQTKSNIVNLQKWQTRVGSNGPSELEKRAQSARREVPVNKIEQQGRLASATSARVVPKAPQMLEAKNTVPDPDVDGEHSMTTKELRDGANQSEKKQRMQSAGAAVDRLLKSSPRSRGGVAASAPTSARSHRPWHLRVRDAGLSPQEAAQEGILNREPLAPTPSQSQSPDVPPVSPHVTVKSKNLNKTRATASASQMRRVWSGGISRPVPVQPVVVGRGAETINTWHNVAGSANRDDPRQSYFMDGTKVQQDAASGVKMTTYYYSAKDYEQGFVAPTPDGEGDGLVPKISRLKKSCAEEGPLPKRKPASARPGTMSSKVYASDRKALAAKHQARLAASAEHIFDL